MTSFMDGPKFVYGIHSYWCIFANIWLATLLCPHIFLLCGKHKIRYANTQIICISPKVIHFSCFSPWFLRMICCTALREIITFTIFYNEILRRKVDIWVPFFIEKYANQTPIQKFIVELNYFLHVCCCITLNEIITIF